MKILGTVLVSQILLSATLSGQERAPFGPLGIVAVSTAESGRDAAMQFSKAIADNLGREAIVTVRDVLPANLEDTSDEGLVTLGAKMAVSWLALVEFEPKDKLHGVFEVDVVHLAAGKMVSRVPALFGALALAAQRIATDASRAAHAVTTLVSQHQYVRVILTLLTRPGEADYTFGTADVRRTNSDGDDVWDTLRPAGKSTLRIFKPGYTDVTIDVIVSVASNLPYIPVYETATLKRRP